MVPIFISQRRDVASIIRRITTDDNVGVSSFVMPNVHTFDDTKKNMFGDSRRGILRRERYCKVVKTYVFSHLNCTKSVKFVKRGTGECWNVFPYSTEHKVVTICSSCRHNVGHE